MRQVPALVRPRLHFLAMISLLFRFLIFYFYSVIDGNGKAHGLSDREPVLPEKLLSLGGTAPIFPSAILATAFSGHCEPPTKIFGSLSSVYG